MATIDGTDKSWKHGGFDAFRRGEFDNGGDNLYATAAGAVEWIHRTDTNGDGHVDLIFPNSHGYDERGPTSIHTQPATRGGEWGRRQLPNDSGWMSHAADLDGDGRIDLIVSRREDGRSYDTESVVYWNGPEGFSEQRVTRLPTGGAIGCTAADLDGDGRPEVVFNNTMGGPSNNDPDFPLYVYPGGAGGTFEPARRLELPTGGTNTYIVADLDQDGHADLVCTAPGGLRLFHGGPDGLRADRYTDLLAAGRNTHYVQVGDFNRNGWLDLLAVAYTHDHKPATMAASSVIFHGSQHGFCSRRATALPTFTKGNARVADLDGGGWLDVVCYDVRGYLAIYHGGPDGFSARRMSRVPLDIGGPGNVAAINCADLTGDGYLDLIVVLMGHYTRIDSGFFILYGGADGYSQERGEFHRTEASSILLTVGARLFDTVQPRVAGAHLLGNPGRHRLRPPHGDRLRRQLRLSGGGHERQRLA